MFHVYKIKKDKRLEISTYIINVLLCMIIIYNIRVIHPPLSRYCRMIYQRVTLIGT